MPDAINRSKLREITRNRDDRTTEAIETAASGINQAELAIRDRIHSIRADLDHIEKHLNEGLGLYDGGALQNQPVDLLLAIAKRTVHWRTLGALLTADELASLRPAK